MLPLRLHDLHGDVMTTICQLVDGSDVISLLNTGCPALEAKVLFATRSVQCERSGLSHFPFSLFELPQLHELDVSIVAHHCASYPLRLSGKLPLPACTKPHLTSLSLSFAQSFCVLQSTAPGLKELLPNLTELHLTNARASLKQEHLQRLPPTLRKLSLLNAAFEAEVPEIWLSIDGNVADIDLSVLPAGLEEVALSWLSLSQENLVWPVGLRKLVLLRFNDDLGIFYHLPHAALEHLEIDFCDGSDGFEDVLIPVSRLPRTLRVFKMESSLLRMDLEGERLPPNIEVWNARTHWESLMVDKKAEDTENVMTSYLPKTLKKMELGDGEVEHIRAYDESGEKLHLLYSFLPFQSLELPNFCIAPKPRLPNTLTSLECSFETAEQVFALPKSSLTRLRIFELRDEFPPEVWSFLGSFLHSLSIFISPFEIDTKELLKALFKFDGIQCSSALQLNQLELTYYEGFFQDIVSYLPTNLTALRVSVPFEIETRALNSSLAQMARKLPNLKSLGLLFSVLSQKWRKLELIPHLPKTLTSLELNSQHITMDPEHMQALPPNLTTLIMRNLGNRAGLTNKHFAHLPKTITRMTLLSVLKQADAEFWAQLPPTIHSINIHALVPSALKAKRAYYARPEWEGAFYF